MSFTITAELPLGTYRGAGADGHPEPLPSVARLHSALLCAAGFGPRAVLTQEDDLGPCDADEVALRWLEEHPPDGVVIPELNVNRGRAVAYRDDGTIKQTRNKGVTKKFPKAPDTAVAVSGRFVWTWRDPPPPPVREALAALCGDVPYIGTTESPVRLAAGADPVEPTHELDRDARFGTGGMDDEDMDACEPGRTAELVAAHRRRRVPARTSSRAAYGTDEWSVSDVPPREKIVPLRYRRRGEPAVDVPWGRVFLVPMSRKIAEPDRVRWAVAAHKELIRIIDLGAPPLVTGVYPEGASRPANRLALHFLDASASPLTESPGATGALAVLVPAGVDDADLAVVADAIDNLRSIRGPRGHLARVVGRPRVISGARFWEPPAPGHVRLWCTEPAAVPDTRGSSDKGWTFAHAALLSMGFVWKAQLPSVAGRRDVYYRNLAQAVTDAGAAVVDARPLRTTAVGRYVHRVNADAVVRPYTARVWLGDLAPPTAVAAIGQSRHLGGGLLVPYDVPEGQPTADLGAAEEVRR
jgi:CRISPR-associated protein Csb2